MSFREFVPFVDLLVCDMLFFDDIHRVFLATILEALLTFIKRDRNGSRFLPTIASGVVLLPFCTDEMWDEFVRLFITRILPYTVNVELVFALLLHNETLRTGVIKGFSEIDDVKVSVHRDHCVGVHQPYTDMTVCRLPQLELRQSLGQRLRACLNAYTDS